MTLNGDAHIYPWNNIVSVHLHFRPSEITVLQIKFCISNFLLNLNNISTTLYKDINTLLGITCVIFGILKNCFEQKQKSTCQLFQQTKFYFRPMRNDHEILKELLEDQNLWFYVHFDKLTCTQSSFKTGAHWKGWFEGNAPDYYSGGNRFESHPGHRISYLKFPAFFFSPFR
jgi:hypothetical protein